MNQLEICTNVTVCLHYFLASATRFANGSSQLYILMTRIPDMISFMKRSRVSVNMAVPNLQMRRKIYLSLIECFEMQFKSNRIRENSLPINDWNGINSKRMTSPD